MGQSASQARAFYREVAKNLKVWTIKDEGGFPAPHGDKNKRSMPFWSTRSKAEKIVANVPAYEGFEVVELDWVKFRDNWLPGLERDGLLVGVNWSGALAKGYDSEPQRVLAAIEYELSQLERL